MQEGTLPADLPPGVLQVRPHQVAVHVVDGVDQLRNSFGLPMPDPNARSIDQLSQDSSLIERIQSSTLPRGVHFLSIDPGDMDTPLHAAAVPDADPSTLKKPETAAGELVDAITLALKRARPEPVEGRARGSTGSPRADEAQVV